MCHLIWKQNKNYNFCYNWYTNVQIWNLDIQFRLSETKLTDKILFGGVGSWCAGARLNLLWQSKEKNAA